MTQRPAPRPLSIVEAVIPVAGPILLVGLAHILFRDADALGSNQVALTVAPVFGSVT